MYRFLPGGGYSDAEPVCGPGDRFSGKRDGHRDGSERPGGGLGVTVVTKIEQKSEKPNRMLQHIGKKSGFITKYPIKTLKFHFSCSRITTMIKSG